MASPGIFGEPRREETADANSGARIPPAAQISVGGVQTPRHEDTSFMSAASRELQVALGGVDRGLSDMFAAQRDEWRLEGQLQAAQGETQAAIAENGNFYTAQGAQLFGAQTAMQEFQAEAMTGIEQRDHQENPTQYRERLQKQFAGVSDKLGDDPLLRRFASEQAASILPRLISAQTVANSNWNKKNLKEAYTANIFSSAGVFDPNDPNASLMDLKEKTEPGASGGLSIDDENEAVIAAAVLDLDAGRSNVVQALGGLEELKARGATAAQLLTLQQGMERNKQKGKVDFANGLTSATDDLINRLKINPNMYEAIQGAQGLLDDMRKQPQWSSHVATSTDKATLARSLDARNPLDNINMAEARINNLMRPAIFNQLTDIYSGLAQGTLKGDTETGVVAALAKQAGVTEQDVHTVLDTFKQTDERIGIDIMARSKAAVQSTLDAQTKLATYAQAWAHGTVAQLTGADRDAAISTQWSVEKGNGEAAIAAGLFQGSPEQYAESKVIPALSRMDIIDKSYATSLQASFNRGVINKDGKVDTQAVIAYDTLKRMKTDYGLSDYQIQQYLGGNGSNSSKLFAQAQDFDLGDMDTASALHAAQTMLDRKVDISRFSEKVETERIQDLGEELVADRAGWFARIGSYGMSSLWDSDVWRSELDRAARSPEFLGELLKRAEINKAYNPNMSPAAASRMAKDAMSGRVTYIAGEMIVAGKNSSIEQDMGIEGDTGMAANMAVMAWMRDHGRANFGAAYDQFKVVGDDPEQNWLQHWTYGMAGQIADSVGDAQRGVPEFKTRYDADNGGTFYFTLYADQTENAEIPSVISVKAKDIGAYYTDQMKKKGLNVAKFWGETMLDFQDHVKANASTGIKALAPFVAP